MSHLYRWKKIPESLLSYTYYLISQSLSARCEGWLRKNNFPTGARAAWACDVTLKKFNEFLFHDRSYFPQIVSYYWTSVCPACSSSRRNEEKWNLSLTKLYDDIKMTAKNAGRGELAAKNRRGFIKRFKYPLYNSLFCPIIQL